MNNISRRLVFFFEKSIDEDFFYIFICCIHDSHHKFATFIFLLLDMWNKSFLLDYDEEKLNAIDAYCNSHGIPRVELFRRLADSRLSENKKEAKEVVIKIQNYLDNYRDAEMSKAMSPESIHCWLMVDDRELLKRFWDDLIKAGTQDEGIMLKDISHRQRYLEINPDDVKTFSEYVDWKYTNPDLVTY